MRVQLSFHFASIRIVTPARNWGLSEMEGWVLFQKLEPRREILAPGFFRRYVKIDKSMEIQWVDDGSDGLGPEPVCKNRSLSAKIGACLQK